MNDVGGTCAILGAGVIGLALAEELAGRGRRAVVFERESAEQRITSWAAAGILPPGNPDRAHDTYNRLCGLSLAAYPAWTARLRAASGIDAEYLACGGVQIARTVGELASLACNIQLWQQDGIQVDRLDDQQLLEYEPALRNLVQRGTLRAAYRVPGEAQVRCSRLVKALRQACVARGVELCYGEEVCDVAIEGERVVGLTTTRRRQDIEQFCVTGGAWTDQILRAFNIHLDIQPWRGQIVQLGGVTTGLRRVINEGPNYLVPRQDGTIVVGATVEEVGYDWRTTEAIEELREFAIGILPGLSHATVLDRWAGLRPRSNDGFPYLGRIPGLENGYVAAGHFRSGIVLAPMTAMVMSDLIVGNTPPVDLAPFRLDR